MRTCLKGITELKSFALKVLYICTFWPRCPLPLGVAMIDWFKNFKLEIDKKVNQSNLIHRAVTEAFDVNYWFDVSLTYMIVIFDLHLLQLLVQY